MKYQADFIKVWSQITNPKKIPWQVADVLQAWAEKVEMLGLYEVRKEKLYRDHALKGLRDRERSITLSYQWRAIYTESQNGELVIIRVEEVTPHDYRKK